jgi:NADH-quinone oxidoreductase subunit E
MSFYQFFKEEGHALGKHRVWVCRSISCMLRGSEELLLGLSEKYGVKPGHKTGDGKFTLEFAECLGACEGAPCMLVDEVCLMILDDQSAAKLLGQL